MTMDECPKFRTCNAVLCPLDDQILQRHFLKDEALCYFLREWVKPGAAARFDEKAGIYQEMMRRIPRLLPMLLSRYVPLKRRLATLSRQRSRLSRS